MVGLRICAAAWAAAMICAGAAAGQTAGVKITDPKDRQTLAAFVGHTDRLLQRLTPEYCRRLTAEEAEGICWKALPQAAMPLTAYELTGDRRHLETFVRVMANLRSALTPGADGFLGWYGKALPIFQDAAEPDRKVDVIITSFRAAATLCRFIEIIDAEPELAQRHARQRSDYLDLMTKHLVEKWTARGCRVDLGPLGAVYRTPPGLRDTKARLTLPHNKHAIVLSALAALYRVSGSDEHMAGAVRLAARFKRCLALKDGHYEWNYWDPAGAWDIHPAEPDKWKHWIGPEHRGGYYSASLAQAIEMYDHGLVFDRADVDRFLKTQMEMTWNGSLTDARWYRVDRSPGLQQGSYICPALAGFHARIHTFCYEGPRQDERLRQAGHPWQGGPVAAQYLAGKYLAARPADGTGPAHLAAGRRFLAKPANAALVRSLSFTVAGAGYRAPRTPRQMKPLAGEPARR